MKLKQKFSSAAIIFFSMALTLNLTDQVARSYQESRLGIRQPSDVENLIHSSALPNGGLGAFVECEPRGIRVVSLLPGHAGDRTGLKLGDRIVGINGESTEGYCYLDYATSHAVQKLRGKIGSTVVLDVERGEGIWQRTFRTELVRQNILEDHSVYSRLENGELTIRVLWLGSDTAEQLTRHLSQPGDYDKVTLDLTNLSQGNRVGFLETAGVFLEKGTKVGFLGQEDEWGKALETTKNPYTDKVDALLIGPYTARYGELLARALDDNLDVIVEGEKTAGLGHLDSRTIRSRTALSDNPNILYDAHGEDLEGNSLKPDFKFW